MANKKLTPGTKTPASGIYGEVNSRGGKTGEQISSTKDHPLPPTGKPNEKWQLIKPAIHKDGKQYQTLVIGAVFIECPYDVNDIITDNILEYLNQNSYRYIRQMCNLYIYL